MSKILILQSLYNLSDDQTELQISDRLAFMRFLGLSVGNTVPGAKTIRLFPEQLTQADKGGNHTRSKRGGFCVGISACIYPAAIV